MKLTSSVFVSGALLTLALASVTHAATATTDHPCASVTPDIERLACYDKAFGAPRAHSNGAQPKDFGFPAAKPFSDPGLSRSEDKKEIAITAVISTVERRRDGKFLVTLDNGQTWLQSETDSRIQVNEGDTVSVRRGALGSYLLSNRDGLATRVKRLR